MASHEISNAGLCQFIPRTMDSVNAFPLENFVLEKMKQNSGSTAAETTIKNAEWTIPKDEDRAMKADEVK